LESGGFDYVIVGAGASGSALAAALTDDPACSVLLVEAGRYFGRADQYPELLQRADRFNFSLAPGKTFPSEPPYDRYCWSYEGRLNEFLSAQIVRGRVVGGSTAINGAAFIRARAQDYDGWAAAGNTEWSFEKVLPALRAIETDLDFGDTELHGAAGPVPVRRTPENELSAVSQLFTEAAMDAGHSWDADINGRSRGGVGVAPSNAVDGVRQNAGAVFLDRVMDRPNLSILDQTHVRRIRVEKGVATGVEVIRDGAVELLSAREIILCAGALNSPHLLMLSGIGPAGKLAAAGVEPICDLPHVGANLADHPYVVFPFTASAASLDLAGGRVRGVTLHCAIDGGDEDVRIGPFAAPRDPGSADERALLGFNCCLGAPESRGEIVLRPASPESAPLIQFNYLSAPEDRRRMRDSVRFAAEITDHSAYRKIGAALSEVDRTCLRDDAALDHWIATHLLTAYHGAGTCKMGPDKDETAVVDQYGRVRGVDRLRVADISILPTLMTRGTHATAVMIGEHFASLIRHERRGHPGKT
jgi:predicted dehydrogenase (TIGR03970 family)